MRSRLSERINLKGLVLSGRFSRGGDVPGMDDELTILHVEDDPLLAHLVKMAFIRFGFQGDVLTAVSVNEALRLLARAENKRPLSLVVTDVQLPDGTGLDLIREVKTDPA